jgi:hypothetical protein
MKKKSVPTEGKNSESKMDVGRVAHPRIIRRHDNCAGCMAATRTGIGYWEKKDCELGYPTRCKVHDIQRPVVDCPKPVWRKHLETSPKYLPTHKVHPWTLPKKPMPNKPHSPDCMCDRCEARQANEATSERTALCPSDATTCSAAPAVNLRNVLIVLAADMLMTDEIPSSIADDWDFSKSTTLRDKVRVIGYARRSREQCRKWAIRLRAIADSLPNTMPPSSNPLSCGESKTPNRSRVSQTAVSGCACAIVPSPGLLSGRLMA